MTEKLLPSAKVVDGILILSLPDALRPVVWQMELGQSRTSALEVREQEDGTCVLTLKTPRQDILDIAPYATKAQAVKALQTVFLAMERAGGHLRQYTAISSEGGEPGGHLSSSSLSALTYCGGHSASKTLRFVALSFVILALVAFFVFPAKISGTSSLVEEGRTDTNSAQQSGPAEIGKPISADDFLERQ